MLASHKDSMCVATYYGSCKEKITPNIIGVVILQLCVQLEKKNQFSKDLTRKKQVYSVTVLINPIYLLQGGWVNGWMDALVAQDETTVQHKLK